MKIKEIMTSDVVSVSPSTSISEVADLIFANRFHGVPVAEKGKLVGLVTEDDFFLKNYDEMYLPAYIRFLEGNKSIDKLPEDIKNKIEKLLGIKAKDIMTTNCITVAPEMDVEELMGKIKETKFTTFPVVDERGNIIGIVTLSDVLGTVRRGSIEMKKAFKGKFRNKEAEELAKELDILWKEKLVLMSKKNVRTWKGIAFISIISFIGLAFLVWAFLSSKSSCQIDQPNIYSLECQKFDYSDWSACQTNGMQTREAIKKLPRGCRGGVPELARKCQ
jgi:CBS domain-containing protein